MKKKTTLNLYFSASSILLSKLIGRGKWGPGKFFRIFFVSILKTCFRTFRLPSLSLPSHTELYEAEVLATKLRAKNCSLRKVKMEPKECLRLGAGPKGTLNSMADFRLEAKTHVLEWIYSSYFTNGEEGFGICGHKAGWWMETLPALPGRREAWWRNRGHPL